MKEKGYRLARVQERVYEELATIVPLEMSDPRVMNCSVTRVEISPDFKTCRVFFADPGSPDGGQGAGEALNHAASFIGARLVEQFPMKTPPRLHFLFDKGAEEADRLEKLFAEIARMRQEQGPEPAETPSGNEDKEKKQYGGGV